MQFVDLAAQFARIDSQVRAAIDDVLRHGQFIMGPEVGALEAELGAYCGARHVVSAASGTDALLMALLAHQVGPGDAVIAPPFTFVATAEVIQLLGAHAVFVDVEEDTFNLDAAQLAHSIERVQREGRHQLKGVIAVDLFGLPADYDAIAAVTKSHDLFLLADGAQSFGGAYRDKKVGALGDINATSFFPAKPLGCYGDGGALFTDDADLAELARSIRAHGMGANRYEHLRTGITGRLDTIQAAVLRCKLPILDDEIKARAAIAERYTHAFADLGERLITPQTFANRISAWAQYTVRSPARDALRAHLQSRDIPTAVYYPRPLHLQPAFMHDQAEVEMPVSERLSNEVLSLPIHPYLDEDAQARVIDAVLEGVRGKL